MRRALVLTDESARHPFRASLPSYVRIPEHLRSREQRAHAASDMLAGDHEGDLHTRFPCAEGGAQQAPRRISSWRLSRDDVRVFFGNYAAFTVAAMAYIS